MSRAQFWSMQLLYLLLSRLPLFFFSKKHRAWVTKCPSSRQAEFGPVHILKTWPTVQICPNCFTYKYIVTFYLIIIVYINIFIYFQININYFNSNQMFITYL